jgi:hypothetical protein
MADYKVPQLQEQLMKVGANKGGNTDIKMQQPRPIGAQRNSAAQADLAGEFNAEKDLATLIKAAAIRANKSRLGAAIQAGERRANVAVKMGRSDGPVGVKKGRNNAGVRTGSGASKPFDNHQSMSRVGTAGSKSDGKVGRW